MSLLVKRIGISLSVPSIVLAMVSIFLFISYQNHEKLRQFRFLSDFACSFCWFTIFVLLHVYSDTDYPWVEHFLIGTLWLGTALSGTLRKRKADKLDGHLIRERNPMVGVSEPFEEPSNESSSRQAMELPENVHRAELASSHLV